MGTHVSCSQRSTCMHSISYMLCTSVCMCIHASVYVPQGAYICCHCTASVCVCAPRAPASCCSARINTLLGFSTLSVNWGGKSRCAAPLSHVIYPVSAVENKSTKLGKCVLQMLIHPQTHTDKHSCSIFCPMTYSMHNILGTFLHLHSLVSSKKIVYFLASYSIIHLSIVVCENTPSFPSLQSHSSLIASP